MDLLLIHPPAAKPSEPPLGTAVLLGHLRRQGVAAEALDASLGAYLHLLDAARLRQVAGPSPSTSLHRAIQHLPRALDLLRSAAGARSPARYATAVGHLEQALAAWGRPHERLSLGDYRHGELSAFSPTDLERLASGEASTLFRDYYRAVLLPRVEALRPRIIGLSVNFLHQVLPAFELAGLLRRRFPEAVLVGGGGVFTSWRLSLQRLGLRFSCFDHLVLGPGEGALTRLVRSGAGGYLQDGEEVVGFDPDFSFAPLGTYLSPIPILPVSASRGCYWRRCLFCPEAASPTHAYRCEEPSLFPRRLKALSRRHGVRHFHLTDNALPLPVLREIAGQTEAMAGLSWHGFVRFEPALEDRTFVRRLAASGCRMLQLGLESASQAVLDRLGKGTRVETAERILANLRAEGIASYVYVLLGTPGEAEDDAEKTLAFLERHAEGIGFLNLAVMNLPRESQMLSAPGDYGIDALGDLPAGEPLGLYRTFSPAQGWGRGEARRFLQRRLLGSPSIREIVQRTPPAFTSNHAFLFGEVERGGRR